MSNRKIPVINNYTKGWNGSSIELSEIEQALAKGRPTFSEHLPPDAMVKPYVDIDVKDVSSEDFNKVNEETNASWLLKLQPLCTDIAVCSRSDASAGKVSYHYTLNGLKCRADLLAVFFQRFESEGGFDSKAYVKPGTTGKGRVWTMVNCFKPRGGQVRMKALTHTNDIASHLVHFATEEDLEAAKDVTPPPPVAQLLERAPKRQCHVAPKDTGNGFENPTVIFDEAKAGELLQRIPADDRDVWIRVGMILKNEGGGAGRKLWDEWSKRSAKFDEQGQDRTWASFEVPNQLHMGSLVHLALSAMMCKRAMSWRWAASLMAPVSIARCIARSTRPARWGYQV